VVWEKKSFQEFSFPLKGDKKEREKEEFSIQCNKLPIEMHFTKRSDGIISPFPQPLTHLLLKVESMREG